MSQEKGRLRTGVTGLDDILHGGLIPERLYLVDGTVYAIGNLCTHEFALLTEGFVEGDAIECPLHQARFSIKTGKVLSEPADTDVPSYPVKVDGDDIYVGV